MYRCVYASGSRRRSGTCLINGSGRRFGGAQFAVFLCWAQGVGGCEWLRGNKWDSLNPLTLDSGGDLIPSHHRSFLYFSCGRRAWAIANGCEGAEGEPEAYI